MDRIAILLKTYKGDIQYVERLIKSYQKFNRDSIPMHIVVPKKDVGLFNKFSNKLVSIHSDESITNNLVHNYSIRGIRPGYVNQEIIKLAFWEKNLCENYFCMDSDGVFIRNFYEHDFMHSKNIPYTILVEDNELKVDPEYYRTHWRGREKLIRKIQKEIGLIDFRMLTCHGFTIFSSAVLESFYKNYLVRKNLTYRDIIKIAPYEFSWYNMWLQKEKTIPIEIKEPIFKAFHNQSQHVDYLRKCIKIKDIARAYIGINVHSNYSRSFGVVSYEQGDVYIMTPDEIYTDIKKIINSVNVILYRAFIQMITLSSYKKLFFKKAEL